MNREILFKAKRVENGKWVEGSYVYTFAPDKECPVVGVHKENHWIVEENGNIVIVDPSTICQCTGLNDKNGKKIWENDIIKCKGIITAVSWDTKYASWVLTRKGWMYHHFFGESQNPEECEVIGNIFDNPELLEGGADHE